MAGYKVAGGVRTAFVRTGGTSEDFHATKAMLVRQMVVVHIRRRKNGFSSSG